MELTGITVAAADGSPVPADNMVQITITDLPSESYGESCLLSDGLDAIEQRMPTEDGTYQMTVAVKSEDNTYTGTAQWIFTIGDGAENTAG